ncbi:hypothetical protein Msil_1183 [Methylocella silvestris BL2]|uniref:Uncharacterized protein n=1 Tax=Methylocella silvestris (strain DSM 15510 / CIP 108128 / LMG 27833 / NCIMB 13906 / BL2) TaxID=395965 RepID=B8EPE7_METSB|nr:hypothetical protein [Methylocella silvestris]ACK50152.1 hypothetical protein Msil_1183 [Methylocella silvestris BL2]
MPEASTSNSVVAGGALGGAIAVIITWACKTFLAYDMPSEVAAAMATVLIAVGGWIGEKRQ